MQQDDLIKKYIDDSFKPEMSANTLVYPVPMAGIIPVCKKLYFEHELPLKTITATDEKNEGGGFRIYYIFGVPNENVFLAPYIILKDSEDFVSITRDIHEASGYERRIKSFFGLNPVGHPHPRQILLHDNWPDNIFPLRKDFDGQIRPVESQGVYEFKEIKGEGIYEIPVGPVHAGIIEPGHFRFSVAGEGIVSLEPKLGYTHKGIEKLFEMLPMADKVRLSERISGDTSFTHSLAFCQAIENLAGISIPERAEYLRVIFSELERLVNHLNDIGLIMLDAGYNFGGANGARLRESIMQWNERLTGNRFLRGVNTPGGVTRDITAETQAELSVALKQLRRDFNEVIEISESSSSLVNRLAGTGRIDRQTALDHGALGVAGRALGITHDARVEYPYAAYNKIKFDMALENEGDVRARWSVRVKEVHSTLAILNQALHAISDHPDQKQVTPTKINLTPNSLGVGVAEGWRGEIVYVAVTDAAGNLTRVDVRDPSFINWTLIEHACEGNVVPDFPLINKSFNLSYSGNDL